jgi:hypothetical protein
LLTLALAHVCPVPYRRTNKFGRGEGKHLWQARYYDFNVWAKRKRIEKLRYMHRNPVKRGRLTSPKIERGSSFRHYRTGEEGVVEIESEWTELKRERMGMPLRVKITELPTQAKPAWSLAKASW